jgi:hypothetical protein
MERQIENLKALIKGVELTDYQRALALYEWNYLLGYVKDLEQLNTPLVSETVEPVCEGTVCPKCASKDVVLTIYCNVCNEAM